MNILITGANGQLGNALRDALITGKTEIGPISPAYQGAKIQYTDQAELDITDAVAVQSFIETYKIDLIINSAAFTNVDACETQPELAFKVNAEGPRILAQAAQKVNAKLVHISTDYVFSGNDPEPRIEKDIPDPQSVYGATKLKGEQYVMAKCDKYYIVRTAWLYGLVGNNFVKTILELAQKNGSIKVVSDQLGNPTSAADLAHELLAIAQTDDYGIYHCTNNGTCSWFDFASLAVDLAGIPCEKITCNTAEFPRPAKRPAFSSLDNAHLRATIGDQMRPWRQALESYIKLLPYADPTPSLRAQRSNPATTGD